jgi:hypothetical protein
MFKALAPLIDDIVDEYDMLRRYDYISIYAPSYIARHILAGICDSIGDAYVDAESNNDLLWKQGDVVVTLANDGNIFVETAYVDKVIKGSESAIAYVYDSFKKKEIDRISDGVYPVLIFGFEDEDGLFDDDVDDDSDEASDVSVHFSEDEDGDMNGFTESYTDKDGNYYSRSLYTNAKLDVDTMRRILNDWGSLKR